MEINRGFCGPKSYRLAWKAVNEFFRQLPSALLSPDYQSLVRLLPGEKSAYKKILGSIPAEESDEEFAAAVDAFS